MRGLAALTITLVILAFAVLKMSGDTDEITDMSVYEQQNSVAEYENISPETLKSYLDEEKDIFLVDVHIPEQKHIKNTDEFIPYNVIENYQSKLPEDKDTEIVVYCRSGNMSETASEKLVEMGYTNVKNLTGGTNLWISKGFDNE
jgi:rhodanese-related sulfurtransferase